MGQSSEVFKHQIKSILVDNRLTRWVGRLSTGKLDSRRIYRAGFSSRVFKQKAAFGSQEYNILLMVDCSGSIMNLGTPHKIYQQTIPKFLDDFFPLANIHVCGFNAKTYYFLKPGDKLDSQAVFEQMQDQYNWQARERTAKYSFGNHDGYCIAEAYKNTIRRSKGQKIVIVLTDGIPHCDNKPDCGNPGCGTNSHQQDELVKTVASLRNEGVYTIGLGMGTDSVKQYYQISERVDDIEQMYEAITKNLKKIIRKPIA